MIHPVITQVFSEDKKTNLFFSWVSKRIKDKKTLQEFIKWHLDVISEAINEIEKTTRINFSNTKEAKLWAGRFLENYEEKIRRMRRASNQIFERFHELQKEFEVIIPNGHEYQEKSRQVMRVFLNKEELLVGKIIFAYRETWFLANQITDSGFKLGSIDSYQEWVQTNFSNLKKVKDSLEQVEKEISQ